MKRSLALVVMACLIAASTFAGAAQEKSKAPAPAQKVTLTGWVRNYTLTDFPEPWQTGKADYEKAHPNVTIQLEGLPYDEQRQKTLVAVSAGKGPDFAYLDCIWLGEYAENNIVIPLTDRFNSDAALRNDLLVSFREGSTWKGQFYGLWSHSDVRTWTWNKELFRKVGLDPGVPPKTWVELREFAKRLTNPAADVWGVGFPASAAEGTADMWYPFLFQSGKGILTADLKKAAFNQEHGQAALQLYYDLMNTDKSGPKDLLGVDEDAHNTGFVAGKYAMIGMADTMNEGKYAGMPAKEYEQLVGHSAYPVRQGWKVATSSGGWIIGITRDSKSVDLAWDFIKFATRADNMVNFIVGEGAIPTRKSIVDDPTYQQTQRYYELLNYLAENTHFRPAIPQYLKIADLLVNAIQRALTGDAGVKAALDQAAASTDQLLAQ
jgi:multiple sugar transport system substrate-binding protein